jgi:hypothetical protein
MILLPIFVMVYAHPLLAQDEAAKLQNNLKSYFNEVAVKVKNTEDPAQKREILNGTFEKVFKAVDKVEQLPVGKENQNFLAAFRQGVQEKYDELNGLKGFARVGDDELNTFADYVVQDMEQAKNIAIYTTTTTLIIIALLIILLA